MPTVTRDDLKIEYEEFGSGEPVVLVHGGFIGAYYWGPLIDEMLRAETRRIITINRRGFGESSLGSEPVTFAAEADDIAYLLANLGLDRVHVAGHSYGGAVSMALTMKRPEMIGSLTLMESPPLALLKSAAQTFAPIMARMAELRAGEGNEAAIDFFLSSVSGSDYRKDWPEGWWDQVVADASTGRIESRDLVTWRPTDEERARVTMPVLLVLGEESKSLLPVVDEGHALLKSWFPHAEEFVLPRATHALHLMNPRDMAAAFNDFLRRHPIVA